MMIHAPTSVGALNLNQSINMKSSRMTVAFVAGALAVAGMLAMGVQAGLGSVASALGYFTVLTVVALVANDYRQAARRLSPAK